MEVTDVGWPLKKWVGPFGPLKNILLEAYYYVSNLGKLTFLVSSITLQPCRKKNPW